LAPPLTWIELLSTGVPILTISVPGIEKIIIPGQTGYLCRSSEELVLNLKQAINNYSIMRNYCNSMVNANYDIEIIADSYLKLFNQRI
jgi:glycosyltransferase involved in cell wall biosynthesis